MAVQGIDGSTIRPGAIENYAKFNKERMEETSREQTPRTEEPESGFKGRTIDTKA